MDKCFILRAWQTRQSQGKSAVTYASIPLERFMESYQEVRPEHTAIQDIEGQ